MHRLVLASRSPRRAELLTKAGFVFDVQSVDVDETLSAHLDLDPAIVHVAEQKARALVQSGRLDLAQPTLVLASDTLVILEGQTLGKPRDEEEAFSFLSRLSGRDHYVKTSVCFWESGTRRFHSAIETSRVFFRELSDVEIRAYIATGQPMDKAGAYGIQDQGGTFIARLEGNLDTVMGLPVDLVRSMMRQRGWNVEQRR